MIKKIKILFTKTLYVSRLTSVKRKKLKILTSVFLANLSVVFDILIIVVFSYLITDQINYGNESVVAFIKLISSNSILLPLIVILRFSFLFLERLNIELLFLDVLQNLRQYLMEEVYELGNMSISDIYFYVNQVGSQVAAFYKAFALFLNSLLQLIGYSLFLLYADIEIFSYFLLGGLLLLLPTRYLLSRGKHYQHLTFNQSKITNSVVQRIVENVFLIKILNTSRLEFSRLNNALSRFRDSQKWNTIFGSINSIMPSFFTIIILSIIFINFDSAKLLSLEFIAVLTRLFQSLGNVNNGLSLVLNSSVNVEELYKLDVSRPQLDKSNYSYNKKLNKAVSFQEVSFKYINSEELIFEKLSFEIKKNEHTIVTGPNGSGKSTLLGLIAGLYIPQTGKTEIFSKDISYVGVTPLVFEGTLRENLLYGNNHKVDDIKIKNLLSEFNFDNHKDHNLDKLINNKSLSSGQLQKISFIRSILNESKILLLDESTSNLDTDSKKLIFKILHSRELTIINSTHNKDDFAYDNHIMVSVQKGKRYVDYE
jgi:ABC-type multidrug transport system fused ATPase/permease subunit